MSDTIVSNVATDISDTEAAAKVVIADAPSIEARVSALESAVSAVASGPSVASVAALATTAASDAAEAKQLASDASAAVGAVSEDVATAKGWIAEVEASAWFVKIKSFFSHL